MRILRSNTGSFCYPLLISFLSGCYAMTVLTGGKSHLEVQKDLLPVVTSNPARNATVPRSSMARTRRSTRTTRKASGARNGEENAFFDSTNRKKRSLQDLAHTVELSPRKILVEGASQAHPSRTKRQLQNSEVLQMRSVCPREPPCDLAPFQAFLPHENMVLGIKNGNVHMLAPTGHILISASSALDTIFPSANPNITAALKIKDQVYLFSGDRYMKYRPIKKPPIYPRPVPVPTGFHGVPVPVDGAFQLNAHTYVFISGPNFVFYQPDANPPVNPAYSPNQLANIFGGPPVVHSAFNTPDGRRFLLAQDTLYELNDKMQIVDVQSFRKGADGSGWLDCATGSLLGCNEETDSTAQDQKLLCGQLERPWKPVGLPANPIQIPRSTSPSPFSSPPSSVQSMNFSSPASSASGSPQLPATTPPLLSGKNSQESTTTLSPAFSGFTSESTRPVPDRSNPAEFPAVDSMTAKQTATTVLRTTSTPSTVPTDATTAPRGTTHEKSKPSRTRKPTTTSSMVSPEDPDAAGDMTDLLTEAGGGGAATVLSHTDMDALTNRLDRQEHVLSLLVDKLNSLTNIMAMLPGQLTKSSTHNDAGGPSLTDRRLPIL